MNKDTPDSIQEVAVSIQTTLLNMWSDFVDHIPFLAAGLMALLFTCSAAAFISRIFERILRRSRLRWSLQSLILRFIVIAIWVAGFLMAAIIVFPGLTPSKALGTMGIASIAIGFAFKDIFENFLAGVLILWRFPFENNDYIECQGISGRVEDISVRMTRIRLISGELIVMPNSVLLKNPVEVLKTCSSVKQNEEIQVFPQAFGPSSLDIEVTWWTDPLPVDIRRSRGEVVTSIKRALDDAGIEIPFPYRTLTFKDDLRINVVDDDKQPTQKDRMGGS